jgi:hypothetical protein
LADSTASVAQQNTILMSRCIKELDGQPVPPDPMNRTMVLELGLADRRKIIREMINRQPGPQLDKVEVTHETCGGQVPLPLMLVELFQF